MRSAVACLVLFLTFSTIVLAGDWPQWRGPSRNGVAADSPKLANNWGRTGPELVWKSKDIPSGELGGMGSPAVADGKVVLYVNWGTMVPLATRTVDENSLRQIGWVPKDKENRPQPLFEMMEKVRLSGQRAAMTNVDAIGKFAQKWVDENCKERNIEVKINEPKLDQKAKDQRVKDRFGWFVSDRLRKGKAAFELAELDRLLKIKDKVFADEKALTAWLEENKFDAKIQSALIGNVPKLKKECRDSIICLDAANGKELWRKEFPGVDHGWGISATPTIADGKVYLIGSTSKAWCFNLADGKVLWEQPILKPAGRLRVDSSFLLVDGLLVVLADRLQALDASNGKLRWKQEAVDCNDNSPVLWINEGKKYVICNTGGGPLACVELESGKLVWKTAGGGCSTTAIEGDTMAVLSGNPEVGLTAYTLSAPAEPKKLWTIKGVVDRGASPLIYDGHVYAVATGKAICVEIATGKEMWRGDVGGGEISSPILADGKIIVPVGGGRALAMLRASPEKFDQLANVPVPVTTCTSPAFADGKLYVRLKDCVACYDLTKEPK